MMKNKLKLLIILLLTLSISSCSNKVKKRIDLIENITDSLYKSIDNLKDVKQIKLANAKVELIKDSIHKISTDKKFKLKYLDDYFVKIDSTEKKLLRKEKYIYKSYASEIMVGKYTGFGSIYSKNYAVGLREYNVEVFKSGIVDYGEKRSLGSWQHANLNLSDITAVSDTLINGDIYYQTKKICSFEWTPKKLHLFGGEYVERGFTFSWDCDLKKSN